MTACAQKQPITSKRRALLARVHIAKKDMGLSDDIYRDAIGAVAAGKQSSKDLNNFQLGKLLDHFKARGWKGYVSPRKKPADFKNRYRQKSKRAVIRKIYVLWQILLDGGIVTAERPDGYVKRMTRRDDRPDGIANTEWIEDDEANAVIESLKRWISRSGLGNKLL